MEKKDVRNIGSKMDKAKAKKWVSDYEKKHPDAQVRGWLFGDEIIKQMLAYDGCEGIWFFKGLNEEGHEQLIMYPANAEGNILEGKIKSLGAAAAEDDDLFQPADHAEKCPPECP